MDNAPLRGELYGIGQEIEHNLIEAHTVTADVLRNDIVDEHVELLPLGADLRLNNTDQAVHKLPQGHQVGI